MLISSGLRTLQWIQRQFQQHERQWPAEYRFANHPNADPRHKAIVIYNTTGQYLGDDEFALQQLKSGLYFIQTMEGNRKIVRKVFVSGGDVSQH